jgi:metallo-beta-lactamase class B
MVKSLTLSAAVTALAFAGLVPADAQGSRTPPGPCPVYKSPEVKEHIDAAYKAIGTDLPQQLIPALFIVPRGAGLCAPDRVAAFSMNPAKLQPTQAFDQLYWVGSENVGSWALKTSGGIILFDAMNNSDDAANIVEPGLKQLGLDPKDVKYIVVTHGHGDHWGGTKYFQDKYGTKILVGAPDVALLNMAPPANSTRRGPAPPHVDQAVTDGTALTLGQTTVHLYLSAGHTPGSVSAIFPVTDHGTAHMVSMYGGYGLPSQLGPDTGSPPRHSGLETYIKSAERFRDLGIAAGVDVAISTHPFFDDTIGKVKQVAASGRAAISPWVMGKANWLRFENASIEVAKTVEAEEKEHPVAERTPG